VLRLKIDCLFADKQAATDLVGCRIYTSPFLPG